MTEQQPGYKIEGRPSTIFRVVKNKENPYAQIDRRVIENADLSFKARGILIYLLSKPDGWEVNMVDINNKSTDGMAAIRSGVKELQEAGYLKHERIHNLETGVIAKHVWTVHESPIPPYSDNRTMDTPHIGVLDHKSISHNVDNPQCGESHLSNKQLSKKALKKEEARKEKIIAAATATTPIFNIYKFSEIVFTKVTGMIAMPGRDKEPSIRAIEALRVKYETPETMVDYLKPFYQGWLIRKYSKTNLAWLTDWAVAGEIPAVRENGKDRKPTFDEEMRRRGLKPIEEVNAGGVI